MATGNPADVRKIVADVCVTPTSLSGTFPFGGTALGLARDIAFRAGIRTKLVTAEEFGGQTVAVVYAGGSAVVSCFLRGYDPDALALAFPNVAAGSVSGKPVITSTPDTETNRAGTSRTGAKVYFAPRAATQQGVLLYNAVAMPEESDRLSLNLDTEAGFKITWHALPDAANRVYAVGLLADLTL